ncbi:hypothetical protein B9J99_11310 [Staphylococcus capitis]|nr:hypothetical protein B9J99_11310 [Staphylococcus capitis]
MLKEVRASYEAYQKRIKLMYQGIGVMLLVFMLFALVMTMFFLTLQQNQKKPTIIIVGFLYWVIII